MKVLVACEFSGTVRDAFNRAGHEAVSCDLLPSETAGPHHQGDILDVLYDDWDLMVAHPPCTYLTNSGVRWLWKDGVIDNERWRNMAEGARFFNLLNDAVHIPRRAIENPIMHRYAVARTGGKATQYVQPWMFGHPENKATGLRLHNLPKLVPTDDVREQMKTLPKRLTDRVHYMSPGPDRWKARSRTYPAIAQAMADQWGSL